MASANSPSIQSYSSLRSTETRLAKLTPMALGRSAAARTATMVGPVNVSPHTRARSATSIPPCLATIPRTALSSNVPGSRAYSTNRASAGARASVLSVGGAGVCCSWPTATAVANIIQHRAIRVIVIMVRCPIHRAANRCPSGWYQLLQVRRRQSPTLEGRGTSL